MGSPTTWPLGAPTLCELSISDAPCWSRGTTPRPPRVPPPTSPSLFMASLRPAVAAGSGAGHGAAPRSFCRSWQLRRIPWRRSDEQIGLPRRDRMSRSPARTRLLIGLAVAVVVLLVAGTDAWAIHH